MQFSDFEKQLLTQIKIRNDGNLHFGPLNDEIGGPIYKKYENAMINLENEDIVKDWRWNDEYIAGIVLDGSLTDKGIEVIRNF